MLKTLVRTGALGIVLSAASILGSGIASAESVPDGVYQGTVNGVAVPIWEGKTISAGGTAVVNRLNGVDRFPGIVYAAPSIYNGAPVVHIDYRALSPELGLFLHDEVTHDALDPNRLNGQMYFTAFGNPIPVLPFTLSK